MLKNATLAGAMTGLLLIATGGLSAASAQPLAKPVFDQSASAVQLVNRRVHGVFPAQRHGNWNRGNQGVFPNRHVGGHSYPRHHRRHYSYGYYAPPVYSYYSGDECHWLKRRAVHTGSRYWWRRYEECKWG